MMRLIHVGSALVAGPSCADHAVRRQAALGSNFAYVSAPALELGEEIQRAVPCAERLRFCASGTEAMARTRTSTPFHG